jgi:hypothetical protein
MSFTFPRRNTLKTNNLIKFSLALCLVGLAATQTLAFSGLGRDWRDFYPDACQELQDATTNAMDCVMCHLPPGNNLNPYGQDFNDAGRNFAAIESMDSDGDGRTNREEILIDCSLPGDPISPTDQDSWGSIKVLFR